MLNLFGDRVILARVESELVPLSRVWVSYFGPEIIRREPLFDPHPVHLLDWVRRPSFDSYYAVSSTDSKRHEPEHIQRWKYNMAPTVSGV